MNDTDKAQPFDEQAALAELERLADKIQATRRQRAHTVAEFETFVKTFRQDRYQELISQHEAELQHEVRAQARPVRPIGEVAANLGVRAPMPPAAATPPVVAAPKPDTAPAAPSPQPPEPVVATYKPTAIAVALSPPAVAPADVDHPAPGIGEFKPEPLPPPVVAPVSASASNPDRAAGASPRSRLPLAAAAAAVVLIAAGFWMFGGSSEAPDAAATPAATAASVPAAAPAPAAESPAAAPSSSPPPKPVPTRALNIELVTVKPVWLRVTVDGTRAIEAELPADRRLPFAADKLIQIRAGNGGAVKLMVAGEDRGLLGADGRVVDRQLTPAPR